MVRYGLRPRESNPGSAAPLTCFLLSCRSMADVEAARANEEAARESLLAEVMPECEQKLDPRSFSLVKRPFIHVCGCTCHVCIGLLSQPTPALPLQVLHASNP